MKPHSWLAPTFAPKEELCGFNAAVPGSLEINWRGFQIHSLSFQLGPRPVSLVAGVAWVSSLGLVFSALIWQDIIRGEAISQCCWHLSLWSFQSQPWIGFQSLSCGTANLYCCKLSGGQPLKKPATAWLVFKGHRKRRACKRMCSTELQLAPLGDGLAR